METNPLASGFFSLTSRFTRTFPRGGKILDGIFYPILGNSLLVHLFQKKNKAKLKTLKKFNRLLVISDIHIGDAVLVQTAVSALRDFFPDAQIDLMIKKSVEGLLQGHPDLTQIWAAFTGGQFPNERDIQGVQELSLEYDAIFNFCPFLGEKLFPEPHKVFHALSHAPAFARNERKPGQPNHITYQIHRFIYDLFSPLFPIQRARPFESPQLFLSNKAVEEARTFLEPRAAGKGLVFLNPDTASPFTGIPFDYQAEILRGLVEMRCHVLLGEGITEKGIGERLILTLPLLKRGWVKLVPASFSLEAYSALIDFSDAFLSGDTGPLHLAAAFKREKNTLRPLRNRTGVFSVFGATPPRLSGYDSGPGFLESGQEAPARVYQSRSSCRNITCMHKMGKVCDAKGCFESLDASAILRDIGAWFSGRKNQALSPLS